MAAGRAGSTATGLPRQKITTSQEGDLTMGDKSPKNTKKQQAVHEKKKEQQKKKPATPAAKK